MSHILTNDAPVGDLTPFGAKAFTASQFEPSYMDGISTWKLTDTDLMEIISTSIPKFDNTGKLSISQWHHS